MIEATSMENSNGGTPLQQVWQGPVYNENFGSVMIPQKKQENLATHPTNNYTPQVGVVNWVRPPMQTQIIKKKIYPPDLAAMITCVLFVISSWIAILVLLSKSGEDNKTMLGIALYSCVGLSMIVSVIVSCIYK